MDHSDRLRSLRRPAGVRPGWLDRRAGAGLKKLLLVLAATVVVLVPAGPALAHNQLVSASPDKNATLRKAPTSITLGFLQKLDPEFTTVVVSDAGKNRIPASAPVVKAKKAAVRLTRPLANGDYTVAYRVVSVDGHTVDGSYEFTVDDPAPPAAAAPSASPAAASPAAAATPDGTPPAQVPVAAEAGSGGAPTGLLVGLGAAGLLLAAVAVYLVTARRRRAATGTRS